MSHTILVVDDEKKITDMVRDFLINEGFEIITASDGEEALTKIRSAKPDLVVLDIMLPKRNGIDVLRELRRSSEIPVVMLTAKAEEVDKLLGLELGADDYLTKPFSLRELAVRIRVVLRRMAGISTPQQVIQVGELSIHTGSMEVYQKTHLITLTPTEYKILESLARNPGMVFTRLQLLEILGEAYYGYERSLDTHVSNLRKKIEIDPGKPKYILTVYGIGYKLGGG